MALSPKKLKVGDLVVIKFGKDHHTTNSVFNIRLRTDRWYKAKLSCTVGVMGMEFIVQDETGIWVTHAVVSPIKDKRYSDAVVVRKVSNG